MAKFPKNPLFGQVAQHVKRKARREFDRTALGQAIQSITRSQRRGSKLPARVQKTIELYSGASGRRRLAKDLFSRTTAGRLAKEVERYAKDPELAGAKMFGELLDSLGPIGKLVRAVAMPGGRRSKKGLQNQLQSAIDFISAFHDEPEVVDWAKTILEGQGYEVTKPGPAGRREKPSRGVPPPKARPEPSLKESKRKTVDVDFGSGKTRRVSKKHPVETGEVVRTPSSSNVHSYWYDKDAEIMYVRFKATENGKKTQAAGPTYDYSHVPKRIFIAFDKKSKSSPGTAVWDILRIRGTLSGHRYDYRLTAITMGYVPRKATLMRDGEWFRKREIKTKAGRRAISRLPNELVRPLNRGEPNRAPPNRAEPNRGR